MGNLTVAKVRSLKSPGRYTDQHGLLLRVSPTGTKSWVWRGTVRGRRRDYGLGSVVYVSLAEARDLAWQYRKIARAGGDPATLRQTDDVPIFATAVDAVIEAHRGGWKNPEQAEAHWRQSLERYAFGRLGRLRLDDITTADIARVLLPIWHDKRETARKLRTRIGVVMRWAVAEGYRSDDPTGPALTAALPRNGAPAKHHTAPDSATLAADLDALDSSPRAWRPTVLCLRFLAATATRSGEARLATWSEIDLDARVWTIPAERTKTQRPLDVPLSAAALAVLAEAHDYSDASGLVFPSARARAMSDSTVSKLVREAGLAWVPHGLRAALRSWAAEAGIDREVAEAVLGHVAPKIERAYQRSTLLERRRHVLDRWSREVLGIDQ